MAIKKSTIILTTATSLTIGAIGSFIGMNATGLITINSKDNELILKVDDVTEEYTGLEIKPSSYSILNGKTLNEGEEIVPTYEGSQKEIGTSISTMTAVIKNKDGVDITSKYNITYKNGEINVTKRKINVVYTDDVTMTTSSEYSYIEKYSIVQGELLDDHIVKGVVDSSILYPGYNLNFPIAGYVIDSVSGTDVTKYYEIVQETSYIQVHPQLGNEKYYDLTFNSYETTFEEGMSISTSDVINLVSAKPGSLYDGDYLDLGNTTILFQKVGSETASSDPIEGAGLYNVLLYQCQVLHEDGTNSKDYQLNGYPVIGTINVKQKEITATFSNINTSKSDTEVELESTVTFTNSKGESAFLKDGTAITTTYKFTETPRLGMTYNFGSISNFREDLINKFGELYDIDNYKFDVKQGTLSVRFN